MQVHFLNWSDKHDQTLPCTSSRIRLPPSHTNDVHDFVEAPSMVPASCRTLAEVTAFKRVCDKEEESGVRKSGRRRAVEADDDADRAEAPGGEEAVPVPSINSGGMYVAASKKRAMNAMVVTTRGLPSRAVALARRSLEHHARPVLGLSEQPASQAAGAGGGAAAAGAAGRPTGPSMRACTGLPKWAANTAEMGLSAGGAGAGGGLAQKLDFGRSGPGTPGGGGRVGKGAMPGGAACAGGGAGAGGKGSGSRDKDKEGMPLKGVAYGGAGVGGAGEARPLEPAKSTPTTSKSTPTSLS